MKNNTMPKHTQVRKGLRHGNNRQLAPTMICPPIYSTNNQTVRYIAGIL